MHKNVQNISFFSSPCGTVCACFCARLVQSDSVTHWMLGGPVRPLFSLLTECSGSVNIDKCALQECLPPCSSPMPQTNEFLKTASIKPQARSIDHRVDFISAAERGLVHMSRPRGLSLYFAVGFCWSRGSRPRRVIKSRKVCPVIESD